jgi:hypothetical protein
MARMRATGVLAFGVLALHELTYLLTGGPAAAHGGHAYLAEALPVVVMLATALLAVSLLAPLGGSTLARGRRGVASRAFLYAGLLLGAFSAQELAEAVFHAEAGAALAPLAGKGIVVAVPLALALGAVAAFATRWLEDVEELLAAAQDGASARPRRIARGVRRPAARSPWRPAAGASLAFGFTRRPPPQALPA